MLRLAIASWSIKPSPRNAPAVVGTHLQNPNLTTQAAAARGRMSRKKLRVAR
ncbi:hypothetical protein PAHAL_4G214700 [Panicum hallii]|uniref:Uncharacterized protein n=1 Tax=Panicum hallii TaxID=206008 RepID=A0A2T8JDK5_9POAL|nr:hypothetical protein PAHAL_4G214700 [Panicum hallii]